MGRRSKVPALMKQLRQSFRSRQLRALKHGPWDCPWCHAHSLFAERKYGGKLLLFSCGSCHLGEMVPRPPYMQVLDVFNLINDAYMKGFTPVFKYKKLTNKQYRYLVSRLSFGQIEVEVWEEDE